MAHLPSLLYGDWTETVGFYFSVTVELSLLILQGHQELGGAPRAAEQTYLYGWWHECPVLVLPGTGWLGNGVSGTPPTPAPLLTNPFSAAVSGQISAWNCETLGLFLPVEMCRISEVPSNGQTWEPGETHQGSQ